MKSTVHVSTPVRRQVAVQVAATELSNCRLCPGETTVRDGGTAKGPVGRGRESRGTSQHLGQRLPSAPASGFAVFLGPQD